MRLLKKCIEEDLHRRQASGGDPFMTLEEFNSIRERHDASTQLMYRLMSKYEIEVGVDIDMLNESIPQKMLVRLHCDECGRLYVTQHINIKGRSHPEWRLCAEHYLRRVMKTPEHRQRNSEAQLIAQNRPDVKMKQAVSQKRRHARPGMKEKYSENALRLWQSAAYRESVSRGLRETWKTSPHLQDACSTVGAYRSQYQGYYRGIRYQSLAELSFVLWAEEAGHKIERFKLEPIQWLDEMGISHSYYPDFVMNDTIIIEVKASRSLYGIDPKRSDVERKFDALVTACKETEMSARIVYVSEDLPGQKKSLYRHAKHVHEACKIDQEIDQAASGESS